MGKTLRSQRAREEGDDRRFAGSVTEPAMVQPYVRGIRTDRVAEALAILSRRIDA